MSKKLNCPNCGAPITGIQCEYCGTQFFNIADMIVGEPGYLRMKLGNSVNFFKAVPTWIGVKMTPGDSVSFYSDDKPISVMRRSPDITVNVELRLVEEEGVLLKKYIEEEL